MFRKWSKSVTFAVVISLIASQISLCAGQVKADAAAGTVTANTALYDDILNKESDWIAGLQFESGAIPTYSAPLPDYQNKYKVVPYFTHFGLLGLLEKPENGPVVKKYMDWYFAHLNKSSTQTTPAGSVYDYFIETDKQTETSTADFDSTDSYASTFMDVLRKYAEVTGDTAYLQAHKSDILLIASALVSTKQADGLTWAKPSYPVKYLMDNSEVYKGLHDLVWICQTVFGDDSAAAVYQQHEDDVYSAIQNVLWSESKQDYSYAKMNDDSLLYPDWNSFYADATSQLFPIWTGVLSPDSERARKLYNTFNSYHPGWPQLHKGDSFPWALVAYTAAIMGDRTRVDQFLNAVKTTYLDQNHPWPWYVMESGVTMMTAALMKQLPESSWSWSIQNLQDGAVLTSLPYTVTGSVYGVSEVEFNMTNELTEKTVQFKTPVTNGTWQLELAGLTNGSYKVDALAKDRFENVLAEQSFGISVQIDDGNPIITRAVVSSEQNVLHRGESTMLHVSAFYRQ